jgi:hypothetical protein
LYTGNNEISDTQKTKPPVDDQTQHTPGRRLKIATSLKNETRNGLLLDLMHEYLHRAFTGGV